MMVYIENPIVSTKKLLNLISKFAKVEQCKVNIQKSMPVLYTNNELSERETRNTNPTCYIATREIKCLEINLTKDVKHLYLEDYRTLKKEIEDNKWKHVLC